MGPVDPKFQVEGVAPHQPFFFSENYDKCSFVWYKNLDRSFFRFARDHACDRRTVRQTDRQTDGRTEFSTLYRVCITCSAVIKRSNLKESHWEPPSSATQVRQQQPAELQRSHQCMTCSYSSNIDWMHERPTPRNLLFHDKYENTY